MRKSYPFFFGFTMILFSIIFSSQASAVSQGDTVTNSNGISCTVGYIDKNASQAYIARHCASTDGNFYHNGKHIGTMDASTPGIILLSSLPGFVPHDSGKVNLVPGEVGANWYSGDSKASHHVAPGTQVCSYGKTTGRTTCGVAIVSTPTDLYVANPAFPGDSGGPNWTSDGFVGTTTAGGLFYRIIKNEY